MPGLTVSLICVWLVAFACTVQSYERGTLVSGSKPLKSIPKMFRRQVNNTNLAGPLPQMNDTETYEQWVDDLEADGDESTTVVVSDPSLLSRQVASTMVINPTFSINDGGFKTLNWTTNDFDYTLKVDSCMRGDTTIGTYALNGGTIVENATASNITHDFKLATTGQGIYSKRQTLADLCIANLLVLNDTIQSYMQENICSYDPNNASTAPDHDELRKLLQTNTKGQLLIVFSSSIVGGALVGGIQYGINPVQTDAAFWAASTSTALVILVVGLMNYLQARGTVAAAQQAAGDAARAAIAPAEALAVASATAAATAIVNRFRTAANTARTQSGRLGVAIAGAGGSSGSLGGAGSSGSGTNLPCITPEQAEEGLANVGSTSDQGYGIVPMSVAVAAAEGQPVGGGQYACP